MCHIRSTAETQCPPARRLVSKGGRGGGEGLGGGAHARPFVGVFQSQFLQGLSTFDNNSKNGPKTGETAPRPGTGYPHEGPSEERGGGEYDEGFEEEEDDAGL